MLPRRPLLLKLDIRALNVRPGQLRHLQAFYFLPPRLNLARPRSRREASNKFIQLRDLLFTLRVLRFDLRAHLRLGHDHVVITAGVGDDGLVVDVGNVRADAVQEMTVVRDRDHDAVVHIQKSL